MKLRLPNVPPGARLRLKYSRLSAVRLRERVSAPTTTATASGDEQLPAQSSAPQRRRHPEQQRARDRDRQRSLRRPTGSSPTTADTKLSDEKRRRAQVGSASVMRRRCADAEQRRRPPRRRAGPAPSARSSDRDRTPCTAARPGPPRRAPNLQERDSARRSRATVVCGHGTESYAAVCTPTTTR